MIEENKAKQLANMAALQNAINQLPFYIESMAFAAKTAKIRYDAYVNIGFTHKQSLFLCNDNK